MAASPSRGPAGVELRAQDSPEAGESYWNHLRWQFLIPEDQAFFQTGTLGASPRVVVDAVAEHLRYVEESLALWDYSPDQPERLAGYRPEKGLRQKLAAFIHADLDEVGLTANATMAMILVANGLDLAPGDGVLMTDREHPGGRCGWDVKQKRYGVGVREVPVPEGVQHPDEIVDAFQAAVTPRTRELAVPHIVSGNGLVMPNPKLVETQRAKEFFGQIHLGQLFPRDILSVGKA